MIADLFLRTYYKDFYLLPYLARSLNRHARGWRKLIVVVPEGQPWPTRELGEYDGPVSFHHCRVYPNDYLGQQVSKLRAWEWSDADVIGYLDSDLVFTRPFVPPMGYHRFEIRPWSELIGDQAECWRNPTRDLLGWDPPVETMCRHPFVYPRRLVQRCYEHVGGEAGLLGYGKHFSEFNLLGNYAYKFSRDHASGADPAVTVTGPDICRQSWSHGGLSLEDREWFALNGYDEPVPADALACQDGVWMPAGASQDEPGDTIAQVKAFWHVGAGSGTWARAYAATGAQVLATEMDAIAYECLARNCAGRDNVTCLKLAIGAPDEASLRVEPDGHVPASIGVSESATLDDLATSYPAPELVRFGASIDVAAALRGAQAMLAATRPVLQFSAPVTAEALGILALCRYDAHGDEWRPR